MGNRLAPAGVSVQAPASQTDGRQRGRRGRTAWQWPCDNRLLLGSPLILIGYLLLLQERGQREAYRPRQVINYLNSDCSPAYSGGKHESLNNWLLCQVRLQKSPLHALHPGGYVA